MKKIIARYILLVLSCTLLLCAQNLEEENTSAIEQSVPFEKIKSIFLSYEETPERVYVNGIFTIKVKAIIANNEFEEIQSDFIGAAGSEVLNPDAKWQWFSDNIFYNTYYLKVKEANATLPDLRIGVYQNAQLIEESLLAATNPNIIALNASRDFSGILAQEFKVKKSKTSRFDDKSLIIVIEMESKYGNLGDFKLDWVIKDGIDTLNDTLPISSIYYYAIIPNYTKKFDFTYFNTLSNRFEKISLPIVVDDETLSTQIDLNPNQSDLQIYKDASYGVVGLIFLLLFWRRKKIVYLFLVLVAAGLFIYSQNPLGDLRLQKGINVRILPTEKSTVFYVTPRVLYAQVLGKNEKFIKLLLPNGKIGWIKAQDALKD